MTHFTTHRLYSSHTILMPQRNQRLQQQTDSHSSQNSGSAEGFGLGTNLQVQLPRTQAPQVGSEQAALLTACRFSLCLCSLSTFTGITLSINGFALFSTAWKGSFSAISTTDGQALVLSRLAQGKSSHETCTWITSFYPNATCIAQSRKFVAHFCTFVQSCVTETRNGEFSLALYLRYSPYVNVLCVQR